MPTKPSQTRKQRGGSKRWIHLPEVTNVDSMLEHVDIQYVMGHGETTPYLFFVVPENTFVYYVGPSGFVDKMGSTLKLASFTPQKIYENFFTPNEPKYLESYPGAHVYVPGDILPLSRITFRHFVREFAAGSVPMGVYRKPFTAEVESYFGRYGIVTVLHYSDVDTMARIYPPVRGVEFRDDLETPVADAPADVAPSTRRALFDTLVSHVHRNPTFQLRRRYDYLVNISKWYGISLNDLIQPAFWFKHPEVMYEYTVQKQFYTDGNLLLPDNSVYLRVPHDLDKLIEAVPSAKPYRLMLVSVCRAPTSGYAHQAELSRLAQRLSSASKEEAVQCVTSERRNPVFNLAAVKAAYERLLELDPRFTTPKDKRLKDVLKLLNYIFEKTKGSTHLSYYTRLPAIALYDAMKVIRPDDPRIDSIPEESIRAAFRDVVEALYAAFHPVAERIKREFAGRTAPYTKFLEYTTGHAPKRATTQRKKKSNTSARPDPTGEQQENRNSSNT